MTVSAMACIGSKVRPARDPDETEGSGDEEPEVALSNGQKWMEKTVPLSAATEDTNGGQEKRAKLQAKSVVEAFGEVGFPPKRTFRNFVAHRFVPSNFCKGFLGCIVGAQ